MMLLKSTSDRVRKILTSVFFIPALLCVYSCIGTNTAKSKNAQELESQSKAELCFYGIGEADSLSDSSSMQLSVSNAYADLAVNLTDFLKSSFSDFSNAEYYSDLIKEIVNESLNYSQINEKRKINGNIYRTLVSFNSKFLPDLCYSVTENYLKSLKNKKAETLQKLEELQKKIEKSIKEKSNPKELNADLQLREAAESKANEIIEKIELELNEIKAENVRNTVIRHLDYQSPILQRE